MELDGSVRSEPFLLRVHFFPSELVSAPKVTNPINEYPNSWRKKFDPDNKDDRPCCKLRLALYGHPHVGNNWETHSPSRNAQAGYEPVTGWESLWAHRKLRSFYDSICRRLQASWLQSQPVCRLDAFTSHSMTQHHWEKIFVVVKSLW